MSSLYTDLENKSVFITGGRSGIGGALTDGFLAHGAKVSFVSLTDATSFCDAMEEKHARRPYAQCCDIGDINALQQAMAACSSANGPISVLINNAANDQRHDALEVTESFWDWSMGINLKSYFFACQAVIDGMRRQGGGSIINMTSISYMMGQGGYPAYAAANAGITSLTRSFARDYGPDNIRVNAIAPGWVMTERQRKLWATPAATKAHLEKQCLKSVLEPEDMVGPCVFLASAQSKAITSQVIVVDGGVVVTG